MSLTSLAAKVEAFFRTNVVERATKTAVQVTAAQVALLGTNNVSYSNVKAAVITGLSTALSLLGTAALAVSKKRQNKKLAVLAAAIEAAVAASGGKVTSVTLS